MAQQTGSIDLKATKKAHDDAKKVATNYLTDIDNAGLMVHPEGDNTTGWKISSALELLKSGVTYIKAWLAGTNSDTPTVQIGRDDAGHSVIDENGMRIYGGAGTELLATIGYGESVGTTGATSDNPYFTFGSRQANSVIGAYSQTQGVSHEASGYASHAEGYGCQAMGNFSHAEGNMSIAYGPHSHAEGFGTDAHGAYSHAEGSVTEAIGLYSHAEGDASVANGAYSHAEGGAVTGSSGSYAHAEGGGHANGVSSHAEGGATANAPYSHAENDGTASGPRSHAEGNATTDVGGDYAHAEGGGTASDEYAHAEGLATTASGKRAHAEGLNTTASGYNSHAQNIGTKAASDNQTAIGKYNIEDANDDFALIVGNGTADDARSNALTVDWNGNVEAAGDVTDGSGNTLSAIASLLSGALKVQSLQIISSSTTIAAGGNTGDKTVTPAAISGYTPILATPRNTGGNGMVNFYKLYMDANHRVVFSLANPRTSSVTFSAAYVNVLYVKNELVG